MLQTTRGSVSRRIRSKSILGTDVKAFIDSERNFTLHTPPMCVHTCILCIDTLEGFLAFGRKYIAIYSV